MPQIPRHLTMFLAPLLLAASASFADPRNTVQAYRTMMPEAGPSSFAVTFPGGMCLCYDPQRSGVSYVWRGEVDLSPTRQQKINEPARIVGEVFYRETLDRPLRLGDGENPPALTFRGYSLGKDFIEFRYSVDAVGVRERISVVEGAVVRRLSFDLADAAVRWIAEPQKQAAVTVTGATRDGAAWKRTGSEPLIITLRAEAGR